MAQDLLDQALRDEAGLRPLPENVAELLRELNAPPRLAAHLRAVHDVAWQLTDAIAALYPALPFDRAEVLFGAATHDIGKTIHTEELSAPGHLHEYAGSQLLIEHGISGWLARFAASHGSWTAPDITTEELLVSLADKIWKAKREQSLEDRVVEHIRGHSGEHPWQVFMNLDDLLTRIAQDSDARLAFQNRHSPSRSGSF